MCGNDIDGVLIGTRICMVVYSYYPMDQRVRREAESLSEAGALVHVICLKNKSESIHDVHNNISIYRIPFRLSRKGGFLKYFFRYFVFLFLSYLILTYLFIKNRYRIVHVHSLPDYQVFCSLIPKMFGAKIILDLHELMPEIFATKFNFQMNSKRVKIAKFLENVSVRYSDYTITTSQVRKGIVRRRTRKRNISVIMNLPKTNTFLKRDMADFIKRHDLERTFIVSYVGRIDPVRELEVVVRAIKHLENKIPNIVFIFCGSGEKEYLNSLKKLIKELNIKKRIILTGQIPQEYILNYIELSNVSICPYRYYPTLRGVLDGISSTKVFEYLMVPRPVIVADFPANRTEFNDLVLFYKSGDPRSLGEKIFEVYEDEEEFKKMAKRAQDTLFKRYDSQKNEKKLIEVYKKLLNK